MWTSDAPRPNALRRMESTLVAMSRFLIGDGDQLVHARDGEDLADVRMGLEEPHGEVAGFKALKAVKENADGIRFDVGHFGKVDDELAVLHFLGDFVKI